MVWIGKGDVLARDRGLGNAESVEIARAVGDRCSAVGDHLQDAVHPGVDASHGQALATGAEKGDIIARDGRSLLKLGEFVSPPRHVGVRACYQVDRGTIAGKHSELAEARVDSDK